MRRGRGFTLIELLVVIAIVALLFGILMPALSLAREQGRRAVCAQNEKNMTLGLIMYASDHDGKLPQNEVDRWLFDVSYWTTDIILRTGAFNRDIFYCPSWSQRNNIIFWRYGENLPSGTSEGYTKPEPRDEPTRKDYHRIIGYFWFIDYKGEGRGELIPMSPPGDEPREWVKSIVSTERAPALVELMSDCTVSNGPDRDEADFTGATGGCWDRWQITDRSNHVKGTRATGGNVAFVDGHVQWRPFDKMELRWPPPRANPSMWW
jgi:prepilin-type N-terminal cleavage/methylation domain-containing protein/prepilin-type processing-associated H-X9-DG protein